MLLKSRAPLTCFRACFLTGRAKDLSAPQYFSIYRHSIPDVISPVPVQTGPDAHPASFSMVTGLFTGGKVVGDWRSPTTRSSGDVEFG